NCPDDSNSDQANLDNDSLGDVCDPDADGDGYISDASNFGGNDCADDNPLIYPGQIEDPFNGVDDNCVNGTDEPLSVADFYDVIGNNQLVVPAPGVLANDLSQNTITSAILHSPAVHPELIWNGDGGFTFNPPVGFTGTYTFSYNATDQYDTISSTAGIVTLTQTELFCGLPISAYTSIIDGTPGNDNLQGTNGDDLIRGFAGDDKINGKKGNDCIYGGSGDDKINGGSGNDTIFGEEGNDKINGNNGDDYISGGDGNDKINGNNGIDTLYGDAGKDTIHGGNDNDYINGGTELDKCYGGNGNNVIDECEILKKFDDDNEGEDSDNNQSNSNHDDKGKSDDKKDDKGKSDDKKDDKGKKK
ncbi:calcium-binding protein, partial [Candidatus Nitrosarchaeum limnium]